MPVHETRSEPSNAQASPGDTKPQDYVCKGSPSVKKAAKHLASTKHGEGYHDNQHFTHSGRPVQQAPPAPDTFFSHNTMTALDVCPYKTQHIHKLSRNMLYINISTNGLYADKLKNIFFCKWFLPGTVLSFRGSIPELSCVCS